MVLRNRPLNSAARQQKDLLVEGDSASGKNSTSTKKQGVKVRTISLIVLLVFLLVFFFVYVTLPISIRYSLWVRDTLIFVHHFRTPFFANISDPHSFDIQAVRQFELFHENNCSIEVWQILSKDSYAEEPVSEDDFIHALSDGSAIILYLHGNTGTRATTHRVDLYKYLSGKLGYHVITFDYRGFGNSQCYPSELGMMEDALLAWMWLRVKAPGAKIYIWGHSLGSAAATYLAQNRCLAQDQLSGLILEAPFTNIMDAAQNHPLSLPYRPIMPLFKYFILDNFEQKFASEERMGHITCPILILHGRKDSIIPFHLGEKLYQKTIESRRATGSSGETGVKFLDCEEAGHKTTWKFSKVEEALKQFIQPR